VQIDRHAQIAAAALALLGCPFKLHGRIAEAGIDCVGLIGLALAGPGQQLDIPCDYALRGDYLGRISAFFDRSEFAIVSDEQIEVGDILLGVPGPHQAHFLVATKDGAVHAHAGLRRVVLTPYPLPWPIVGHWRFIGD
jgi:hypothetical protein